MVHIVRQGYMVSGAWYMVSGLAGAWRPGPGAWRPGHGAHGTWSLPPYSCISIFIQAANVIFFMITYDRPGVGLHTRYAHLTLFNKCRRTTNITTMEFVRKPSKRMTVQG